MSLGRRALAPGARSWVWVAGLTHSGAGCARPGKLALGGSSGAGAGDGAGKCLLLKCNRSLTKLVLALTLARQLSPSELCSRCRRSRACGRPNWAEIQSDVLSAASLRNCARDGSLNELGAATGGRARELCARKLDMRLERRGPSWRRPTGQPARVNLHSRSRACAQARCARASRAHREPRYEPSRILFRAGEPQAGAR